MQPTRSLRKRTEMTVLALSLVACTGPVTTPDGLVTSPLTSVGIAEPEIPEPVATGTLTESFVGSWTWKSNDSKRGSLLLENIGDSAGVRVSASSNGCLLFIRRYSTNGSDLTLVSQTHLTAVGCGPPDVEYARIVQSLLGRTGLKIESGKLIVDGPTTFEFFRPQIKAIV